MFADLMEEYRAELLHLGVDSRCLMQLAQFLDRLWQENRQINLFSRKMDAPTLVVDHLIDSLLGLPHVPDVTCIADLGTGGGFPAVPLAICRAKTRFHLYEKSVLKRRYLMGLTDLVPNLKLHAKVEDSGLDHAVELVVSRAFKPIGETLLMTRSYLQNGGSYLLFKARRARIDEELANAQPLLRGAKVKVVPLDSHLNGAERHLVCIN